MDVIIDICAEFNRFWLRVYAVCVLYSHYYKYVKQIQLIPAPQKNVNTVPHKTA